MANPTNQLATSFDDFGKGDADDSQSVSLTLQDDNPAPGRSRLSNVDARQRRQVGANCQIYKRCLKIYRKQFSYPIS